MCQVASATLQSPSMSLRNNTLYTYGLVWSIGEYIQYIGKQKLGLQLDSHRLSNMGECDHLAPQAKWEWEPTILVLSFLSKSPEGLTESVLHWLHIEYHNDLHGRRSFTYRRNIRFLALCIQSWRKWYLQHLYTELAYTILLQCHWPGITA